MAEKKWLKTVEKNRVYIFRFQIYSGGSIIMLVLQLATAAPLLVLQIQMILTLVGKNL